MRRGWKEDVLLRPGKSMEKVKIDRPIRMLLECKEKARW
jgi:hypothetical protein